MPGSGSSHTMHGTATATVKTGSTSDRMPRGTAGVTTKTGATSIAVRVGSGSGSPLLGTTAASITRGSVAATILRGSVSAVVGDPAKSPVAYIGVPEVAMGKGGGKAMPEQGVSWNRAGYTFESDAPAGYDMGWDLVYRRSG